MVRVNKTICIADYQQTWLDKKGDKFNLSQFVQDKLDKQIDEEEHLNKEVNFLEEK